MITSVYFDNFKTHQKFSISLKNFNILIGQNNSGKSSILDAFRVLEGAYRFASRYNPKMIRLHSGEFKQGYEIPIASIPITIENLQTDYNELPATIRYRFQDAQNLYLEFTKEHQPILYFDTPRKNPNTSTTFKREFNLNLAIVPTLGPFELNEELLDEKYVKRWSGSRRAPRMFRNIWFHEPKGFEHFAELVANTWPGMIVNYPERKSMFSKELMMFFEENRISREIAWAGFGFQIWLQLLTHLVKNSNANIIVVDEPEVYLHPDLQHKILGLLKSIDSRIVLATHSVEIINNADPSDVVLIDKQNQSGKRISDLKGLQQAADLIGSGQNIQLARLARGKRVLFVEGKDLKFLSKLANITGYKELFTTGDITVIPVHGFSQHEKIIHANWAFSTVLGEQLRLAAIFDRDYKCEEDLKDFEERLGKEIDLIHVLARKEIENYILIPSAIEKAIIEKLKFRIDHGTIDKIPDFDIIEILKELTEKLRADTFGQLGANEYRYYQSTGKELAQVIASQQKRFDENWSNIEIRLNLVSGKTLLSILNEFLQEKYSITLTSNSIVKMTQAEDIDDDLTEFFRKLEDFRTC